jgi:hypothetical protein
MKRRNLLYAAFIIGILATILGAYRKIMHYSGNETYLVIGLLAWMLFIALAIYEVASSRRINGTEKTMWVLSLLFFSGIAGIVYLLIGRRRVVIDHHRHGSTLNH